MAQSTFPTGDYLNVIVSIELKGETITATTLANVDSVIVPVLQTTVPYRVRVPLKPTTVHLSRLSSSLTAQQHVMFVVTLVQCTII